VHHLRGVRGCHIRFGFHSAIHPPLSAAQPDQKACPALPAGMRGLGSESPVHSAAAALGLASSSQTGEKPWSLGVNHRGGCGLFMGESSARPARWVPLMRQLHRGSVVAAVVLVLSQLGTPSSATADAPPPVDESRLVPALSPSFAPWTCQTKQEGPVCKAERHVPLGGVRTFRHRLWQHPAPGQGHVGPLPDAVLHRGLPRLLPRVPHQRHRLPQHVAERTGNGDEQHERPLLRAVRRAGR
jgi:hypothetical protein